MPRRWKRLPKSLSHAEIESLLQQEKPATASSLCDQAVLELAYASGLRLAELRNIRLEQLHLEAGFINVIGKGNKERVVPLGGKELLASTTSSQRRFTAAAGFVEPSELLSETKSWSTERQAKSTPHRSACRLSFWQ